MHQLLPGPVPVGSFLGKIRPIKRKLLLIALSLPSQPSSTLQRISRAADVS